MKKAFAVLASPQLQAVLLIVCVFAIGGLAGAAIERAHERGSVTPPHGTGGPGGLPPEISRRLNLSAGQMKEIQAILDRHKPETDAVLNQFLPRLRSITDAVRAEIRHVLRAEQQAIFDRQPPYLIGDQARGNFDAAPPGQPDSAGTGMLPGRRMGQPGAGPAGAHAGPPSDGSHEPPGPPPTEGGGALPGGPGGPGGPPPDGPPPGGAMARPAERAAPASSAGAKRQVSGAHEAGAARARAQSEETPAAAARPVAPPAGSAPSYQPTGPSAYGASGAPAGPAGAQSSGGPSSPPPAGQPSGSQPPASGQPSSAPGNPPPR